MSVYGLDNKVAVITGAAGEIGSATAHLFARQGARLFLADLAYQKVETLAAEIGSRAVPFAADFSRVVDCRACIEAAVERLGRLDILVNNVGICPRTSFLDATEVDWERIVDVNQKSMFFCSQFAAPFLRQTKGRIISLGGTGPQDKICLPGAILNLRSPKVSCEFGTGAIRMQEVIEHYIARRIRRLRTAQGKTLQQISDITGLSKGLLSKIENCIVSPPIATLAKLATALGVPIGEFFETDDLEAGTFHFPKSKRKRVRGPRSELNYEYELLVGGRKRRDMQPMIISIDGRKSKFVLQEHPGEQFIFMLEGSMEYVVGDTTCSVEPGDCLYFDARMPHGPKLQKTQKASYLVVFSGS